MSRLLKSRLLKSLFWLGMLAVAGTGAWVAYERSQAQAPVAEQFRTARVDRGDIRQTVNANGTLNPVTLVNVGTQISGTIVRLNTDYNQPVKAGQILAELDPALILADLAQAEATMVDARATRRLAESKHQRNRDLAARGFISAVVLDESQQALDAADSRIRSIEAQLQRLRTNLGYTVIRSPISGVVIARSVDVGQTVAASFQTPTLFQIARDLSDMQIDTAVAEADVGNIRVGQNASFRVDALPDRAFTARVRQIRLNPTIQQNVVTYNVVLETRNADGVLLPGMTANVRIEVAQKQDVLRVPVTALRFRPAGDGSTGGAAVGAAVTGPGTTGVTGRPGSGRPEGAAPAGTGRPAAAPAGASTGGPTGTPTGTPMSAPGAAAARSADGSASTGRRSPGVFVLNEADQTLRRVPVRTGISDGTHVEVLEAEGLEAGQPVVVGERVNREGRNGSTGAAGATRGFNLRMF